MATILNIETSTTRCSVALFRNNELISCKELDEGYSHAEHLHPFIQKVVQEAGITAAQLQAIAVSKGPGSYTGLRIGVSAAKGLAFALKIPLIGLDTLKIMSYAVQETSGRKQFYCPMIDARRMEVYTCVYDAELKPLISIEALVLDAVSVRQFENYKGACFFGDGMLKSKELLGGLAGIQFIENIGPSARYMGQLAFAAYKTEQFEDVAYFEPYYLKEFLAGKKKSADFKGLNQ